MAKITREMYRKAMELRTPLLRRFKEVILYSNVEYDHLPKNPAPEDVDDGYGALKGRGVLRPVQTATLPPRAQGSMPSRAAITVEIKQRSLRNREYDLETGRIVSNRMPSERGHRRSYSSLPIRSVSVLQDGSKVVRGRRGKILKSKAKLGPKLRALRSLKSALREIVLVEVEE